jgi:hypothetical protein
VGIFLKKMPMPSFGRQHMHPENALKWRLASCVKSQNANAVNKIRPRKAAKTRKKLPDTPRGYRPGEIHRGKYPLT